MKIKDLPKEYQPIAKALPKKPSGLTHKQLAAKVGVSPRQVRAMIRQMRRDGVPVCSHETKGYWLSNKPEEIKDLIDYLNGYALSINHTISKLKITQRRMESEQRDKRRTKKLLGK